MRTSSNGTQLANQATPLEPYNLFTSAPVLCAAARAQGAGKNIENLTAFGARAGSAEVFEWGHLANRFHPELVTHDRFGERIDEVHYHPAYHQLVGLAVESGLHCSHYEGTPGDGSYVARNARMHMLAQVDVGHACPISMTGAVLPALKHQPKLHREWATRIKSRSYDSRTVPAHMKQGCLLGMGLTERQGGSDVRANTSTAEPIGNGGPGGEYRLIGHKWFTSAPMCDAFLILAQAPEGCRVF